MNGTVWCTLYITDTMAKQTKKKVIALIYDKINAGWHADIANLS